MICSNDHISDIIDRTLYREPNYHINMINIVLLATLPATMSAGEAGIGKGGLD